MQRTATQKAIGQCIATVAFGGIAGAILGAATGRNVGSSAAVGAAVGAGACAALLYVAEKEDQQRLAEIERQAVIDNASRTESFTSKKNAYVQVTTSVAEAPVPPPAAKAPAAQPSYTACRYSSQTVDVAGQSATTGRQLWCRIETGDWLPVDESKG